MSLFELFVARGEEDDDDDVEHPAACTRCGHAWWNETEGSWECNCGFFQQCEDCYWFPQWDPAEEAWYCLCGYHFDG